MPGFQVCPYLYVNWSHKKYLEECPHDSFTLAFITGYKDKRPVWDCGVVPDPAVFKKLKHVVLSFGGAGATTNEIAGAITSVNKLAEAYTNVMDTYGATELDFDVEGNSIKQADAIERRNKALVRIQKKRPDTKVNFTLPVMPYGLEPDGISLLKNAQREGVQINMVNIMAMDYGQQTKDMGEAAIRAANATYAQLQKLGLASTKVGVTPMIGTNDTAREVFTLDDARELRRFADATPWVGMLSFWSVNRDNGSKVDPKASDTHSGIVQKPYEFVQILAA